MSSTQAYESLILEVCALGRRELIQRLAHFNGDLRLDFSEEYLNTCDTERLRHLLLAALWRCLMKAHA